MHVSHCSTEICLHFLPVLAGSIRYANVFLFFSFFLGSWASLEGKTQKQIKALVLSIYSVIYINHTRAVMQFQVTALLYSSF